MPRATKHLGGLLLLAGACLLGGCDAKRPTPQELGRIVFKESEVPGADQPYELPEHLQKLQTDENKKGPPGE